jgi:hypothetical protein
MIRKSYLIPLVLCTLFSGCASVDDWHFRNVNRLRAKVAWLDTKSQLPEDRIDVHFGRGFKDGYFDVSTGASNTLPAVPPNRYWAARYQTAEGRCCVENYFAGWQCGANAANGDHRPHLNNIPAKVCQEASCPPMGSYMQYETQHPLAAEAKPPAQSEQR